MHVGSISHCLEYLCTGMLDVRECSKCRSSSKSIIWYIWVDWGRCNRICESSISILVSLNSWPPVEKSNSCARAKTWLCSFNCRSVCQVNLRVRVRVCQLLLLLLHKFTWHTDRQLRLIHLPSACRGRTAVQFRATSSHMCCVELALKGVLCTRLGSEGQTT